MLSLKKSLEETYHQIHIRKISVFLFCEILCCPVHGFFVNSFVIKSEASYLSDTRIQSHVISFDSFDFYNSHKIIH